MAELVGQLQRLPAHPLPVLDRLAHVGQHPRARGAARSRAPSPRTGSISTRIQLSTMSPSIGVVRLDVRGDLGQPPQRLAPDHDQRVRQQVHVQVAGGEQGGHRVDQERHVVGDDLDDRVLLLRSGFVDTAASARPAPAARRAPGASRAAVIICSGVSPTRSSSGAKRQNRATRVAVSWSSPAIVTAWATRRSAFGTAASSSPPRCRRRGRPAEARSRTGCPGRSPHHPCPASGSPARPARPSCLPAATCGPEIGSNAASRTPVHRCHSPRPTTLWVTLRPQ